MCVSEHRVLYFSSADVFNPRHRGKLRDKFFFFCCLSFLHPIMAPKELTPHQVSKGLEYVHKEPSFLARLKGTSKAQEKAKQKFVDYEDGQDDEDYNELDGAQVVELDSKGKGKRRVTGWQ